MASFLGSRRYDVFPSFSGEDVRKSFLSHLLKELDRKLIITFKDHGIERSRQIGPELLLAIRESRISIIVFSKKYASSTWCLNELVEIHKCYEELGQMVIPVFYDVDPSHVRKQTGDFGKAFNETCKDKTEDERQRWMLALAEVANMAGEDSSNWSDEANMIEEIAKDVSNKLITPSNDFGDLVGIEAHIEKLNSMLCVESDEVRMLGIVGPSGIGKTTIARALFSQLSSQFNYCAFVAYKRTNPDDYGMKLCWEEQFLSEILGQKDIKISSLGMVEQRVKHKKVFVVLDDVDDLELLKTLVGKTRWFGFGSRIIVITRDRKLLKSHKIDLIYEVDFPTQDLALQMFCRSAFGQNYPPSGFMELAVEVSKLSGNLPLGLNVLGSSLRENDKEEWMEMMPRLRNGLDGKLEKTLKVGYDGLDGTDQQLFLYIACLLNGRRVNYIKDLLGDSVNIGLGILADKSLIRVTPSRKTVEMHGLLQKLGREIVRAESINNPGKRRFLVDAEDICDVFIENLGTENVLGIHFNTSKIGEPLLIDEISFEGMRNLQFLKFYKEWWQEPCESRLYLPRGLVYLPRKLRLLYWNEYPLKCIPSNFRAEYLVELKMEDSKLEKLWEGTQPLRNLKKMRLEGSTKLKEIPDLSNAINLEELCLNGCTSLVTLPSSIRNLNKLTELWMGRCSKLEVLPTDVNLKSLVYLDLTGCSPLRSFPRISKNVSRLFLDGNSIQVDEDCFFIENISGLIELHWSDCPMRCMPSKFRSEYLVQLIMKGSKFEKLWEGVQSLGSLTEMNLSGSENLKEFPDLSKATNLEKLELTNCKSLVVVPSSIRNLNKLRKLDMEGCTRLEVLPTDVNLLSLSFLNLSGCSQLTRFPQISTSITLLFLSHTAIAEVLSWIENVSGLTLLVMRGCKKLKIISPNIFKLRSLEAVDFSECEGVKSFIDATTMVAPTSDQLPVPVPAEAFFALGKLQAKSCASLEGISRPFYKPRAFLKFHNCFNLDRDAQKRILQSDMDYAVLPGGEVPMYFTYRACGNSLLIPLPQSFLYQDFLGFRACMVVDTRTDSEKYLSSTGVRWYFRGREGVHRFGIGMHSCKIDHMVMFHFGFPLGEVNDQPSELDYNVVEFEFYYHDYRMQRSFDWYFGPTQRSPFPLLWIKGCGIQLLNVSP